MALNPEGTNLIFPSTICSTDIGTPLFFAGQGLGWGSDDTGDNDMGLTGYGGL